MARLISTGELARVFGVTRQTVARWHRQGLITPAEVTAGGHARWDVDDVRAQLRAQRDRDC